MLCLGQKNSFEHWNIPLCLGTIILHSLTGHSTEISVTFIVLFRSLVPYITSKYFVHCYIRIWRQCALVTLTEKQDNEKRAVEIEEQIAKNETLLEASKL